MWKSRKFRAMICDAAFATVGIVLTWFLAPDKVEQALILVGLWQPVVVAYIVGVAVEDAAEKGAGGMPGQG
jgi:hypothetical protein